MGNQPPVFSFAQGGPKFTGPPTAVATTLTAKVNTPIAIEVWVEDPKSRRGSAVAARRGRVATRVVPQVSRPGPVTFERALPVPKQGEQVTHQCHLHGAGEYMVRVQANDESGEGGGWLPVLLDQHLRQSVREMSSSGA